MVIMQNGATIQQYYQIPITRGWQYAMGKMEGALITRGWQYVMGKIEGGP